MFDRVLIANRGEIACRIAATARRLGVHSVAVFSEADAGAAHARAADEAICIGLAAARDSYLRIDRIVEAALASGAQAIHPGYGFLAENPDLALACNAAGIVFVGPPVEAIRLMGDKARALERMAKAGVPVLAGHRGADQSDAALARAARDVGLPLIVKPSAGGGGKGMRVVREPEALDEALASARREARSAFGDDTLLLERFLPSARHVEVQIFADTLGNLVHLLDRDCSVQRRHQKVVEEAPAPGLDRAMRERMAHAALTAAGEVDYVGAGTVEFLVDTAPGGDFFFMEMNTRLQVEHPVTEMITGVDLVEWQLRIAAGEPLPCSQEAVRATGHAIEVRLYAEDPARGNLPSTGTIVALEWPSDPGIRIDAGVRQGDRIGVEYDPMLAKLVAHGPDRESAVRKLRAALGRTRVQGVTTNRSALAAILDHPEFRAGGVDTGLLDRFDPGAASLDPPVRRDLLAAAALWLLTRPADSEGGDPSSPWDRLAGFRLNAPGTHLLRLDDAGTVHDLVATRTAPGAYRLAGLDGIESIAGTRRAPNGLWARVEERAFSATVDEDGPALAVDARGHRLVVTVQPNARPAGAAGEAGGHLMSPMPGTVIAVHVAEGDVVERGRPLLVVEAMKMEHTITAPMDGVVERIAFRPGDRVDEGAELVTLVAVDEAPPTGAGGV